MNDQVKSWLTSKTIWATVFGLVLSVAKAAGLHLPFDDPDVLAGHAVDIASAVLFLAAGIFRASATHKLT